MKESKKNKKKSNEKNAAMRCAMVRLEDGEERDFAIPPYLVGKVKVGNLLVVSIDNLYYMGTVQRLKPWAQSTGCVVVDKVRTERFRKHLEREYQRGQVAEAARERAGQLVKERIMEALRADDVELDALLSKRDALDDGAKEKTKADELDLEWIAELIEDAKSRKEYQ